MKITVNDCLKLDAFKKSKVLTCKENGDRRVKSISVLDEKDVESGVKRNGIPDHIVLTHFWSILDDIDAQVNAVKGLGLSKVSALVIYLADSGVTEVDNRIIEAANEYSLMLITIKDDGRTTYSNLIEQVTDKIIYGRSYSENVINNTIYHLLNFEKHSTFPSALKEAAIHNDFQLVLMTEEFNPILTIETRQIVTIEDAVRIARKDDAFTSNSFARVPINGIISYWGYISIKGNRYILTIVDNEDNYTPQVIRKIAEVIEMSIGMWKYTPQRDSRAEFIKSAVRGDLSFCHTLLEEANLRDKQFPSVFMTSGIDPQSVISAIDEYKKSSKFSYLTTYDAENVYGIFICESGRDIGIEIKNKCLELYETLKSGRKNSRIYHITGIETLESAVDGFRIINRSRKHVELVYPFKRVLSKYEMSMVCDCAYIQNSQLKKIYLDLLEPFSRELSLTKGALLIDTLATFVLDANMNSNMTAKFMNIHNNTVQYRLKKANEILGAEMTANRVIPGLTMALAIRRLEEE